MAALSCVALGKDFTVTFLHVNDTHGRLESTTIKGETYGGFARQMTAINQVRKKEKNVLLFHSGDVFQGTLYFRQYTGLADLAYLNAARYDAMTLGNHEFDLGPGAITEFAERATFPIVVSNLDLSEEPRLAAKVKAYTVLEVNGTKIGVVGAITPDTTNISSPGPTVKMKPLVESVQAGIDALTAQKIDKIVLLSHLGYQEDLALAPKLRGIDVILGGHSHTLLGSTESPLGKPLGPYPTEAKDSAGTRVIVAQANEWGKVLGNLKITFDGAGHVKSCSTDSQIVLDKSVPEDLAIKSMVDAFSAPILVMRKNVLGETKTTIARAGTPEAPESLMGNLIADSMVETTRRAGAQIGLMNSGGIRANFEAGKITVESVLTVQPFGNTLFLVDISGAELKQCLEIALERGGYVHVSSDLKYRFDPKRAVGDRVTKLLYQGKPLAPDAILRAVTNNFMARGGDFMDPLKNANRYRLDTGIVDADALMDYVKGKSPFDLKPEGRITVGS